MYYQCKHCERPVHDYTTESINEWMSMAVVLLPDETRLIGELDTEHAHKVGGREAEAEGTKWLHKVCWEDAGRPEYDAYESPSKRLSEDLFIERKSLWVITPEVDDPEEREQLLADGEAAYEARLFDQMATELDNRIETNPEYMEEDEREFPHLQLFRVSAWSGHVNSFPVSFRCRRKSVIPAPITATSFIFFHPLLNIATAPLPDGIPRQA